MSDELLHYVIHQIGRVNIALVNLALDDRDEPYTPEDRAEVIYTIIAMLNELIEKVGGEAAQREQAQLARIHLLIRKELGG